jgi:hypothetical protein
MNIFPDFESIERRRDEWRKTAKQEFVPGIDPAELKPGMRITISPNLMILDRSYTRDIHTVIAVNASHVQTRINDGYHKSPILLAVHEHHFYDASSFSDESETKET